MAIELIFHETATEEQAGRFYHCRLSQDLPAGALLVLAGTTDEEGYTFAAFDGVDWDPAKHTGTTPTGDPTAVMPLLEIIRRGSAARRLRWKIGDFAGRWISVRLGTWVEGTDAAS